MTISAMFQVVYFTLDIIISNILLCLCWYRFCNLKHLLNMRGIMSDERLHITFVRTYVHKCIHTYVHTYVCMHD